METNSVGERISKLRTNSGLTQKELGDKLNVTAQAVSKWENGLSEPDIDTLKKLSVIFGISVSELIDGETGKETATAQATVEESTAPASTTESATTASPVTEKVVTRIINGYCEKCKKPVGPGEYVVHSIGSRTSNHQSIYCNNCDKELQYNNKVKELNEHRKQTKLSFILGPIAGVAALVIMLLSFLLTDNPVQTVPAVFISIAYGIGFFAFISQVVWDGVVNEIFCFFIKGFTMPGVIFSFDLEGLLSLIFIKLTLSILSVTLSVLWFLLGALVVLPVVSIFIYPFALNSHINEEKTINTRVNSLRNQIKK